MNSGSAAVIRLEREAEQVDPESPRATEIFSEYARLCGYTADEVQELLASG